MISCSGIVSNGRNVVLMGDEKCLLTVVTRTQRKWIGDL